MTPNNYNKYVDQVEKWTWFYYAEGFTYQDAYRKAISRVNQNYL